MQTIVEKKADSMTIPISEMCVSRAWRQWRYYDDCTTLLEDEKDQPHRQARLDRTEPNYCVLGQTVEDRKEHLGFWDGGKRKEAVKRPE